MFCYGVGVCLLTCTFYIVYWMFRLARGSLVTGKDDQIYLFKKKLDCEFSTQNSKQGLTRNIWSYSCAEDSKCRHKFPVDIHVTSSK